MMKISALKALLNDISLYFHLSSSDAICIEPAPMYYKKVEEILRLLKPILDAIAGSGLDSDGMLNKDFEEINQSVEELRLIFESWQPLLSKIYFIIQTELLISKMRSGCLDILQLLSSNENLPEELSSASLEYCIQKVKHMGQDQTSALVAEALRNQEDSVGPTSSVLAKIAENMCLKSNKDILIEAAALEKLKENAEQSENTGEAEYFDQLTSLVTRMHDRLVAIKQMEMPSPVPIPRDFCCPLSLELMTDPVIVASGQTYERAFIRDWLDMGLTVCPKTRKPLAHANLIPNYTVKALIANWCEVNDVKLPDPAKSLSSNDSSSLQFHTDSGISEEQISRTNQTEVSQFVRPVDSPARSLIGSGVRREVTSPLHSRSASSSAVQFRTAADRRDLDIGRASLGDDAEESSSNLEDDSIDSSSLPSMTPDRKEFSNALGRDEPVATSHKRAVSSSNAHPIASVPHGGANGSSHTNDYASDASGEMKSQLQDSSSSIPTSREAEIPPRLVEMRSRSQMIWRRPSDRLVPRIISSSAVETRADLSGIEAQVKKLVEDLKTNSVETQRAATSDLRLLAKHNMDNRIVIANSGAINLLVSLLNSADEGIQENAVTALLNLSINDNNKIAIANAEAIEPLIHVLQSGSAEAKENAAATLFSLSVIEENKLMIGKSGAIVPLVELLGNGTPRGKKDAATALFNLSILHENKTRIVQAGAVKYLVDLMDPAAGMVDKAVAVLANLVTIQEGRVAIGQEHGISALVEVVELGSPRGKENAAAALLQLSTNSNRYCSLVLQEGAIPPLVALSQSGTPRAREKAQALLTYFRNQRHGNAARG
ncbi:hypothetical protein MLD38_030291 [Melastoma candidum]|uniref:Uncharacterized protein n=1 Tax=Melastoma candidum TaxID=119954 RepID=A0ACB9MLE1_9MYRT|nr:hypothetical protein MLD38_030291 [Melastoma candidum]